MKYRRQMWRETINQVIYNGSIHKRYCTQKNKGLLLPAVGEEIWLRLKTAGNIFIKGKIYLPYLEIVVTTKCSLNCKDCGNLMQYYTRPYDVDIEVVFKSIEQILNLVEHISIVRILGGEPFLYPHLNKVLEMLIASNKVKVIGIPTNGTIIPRPEIIKMLQNNKIRLDISDYGVRDITGFVSVMEENGIRHSVAKEKVWQDRGNLECRNCDDEKLDMQMLKCTEICRSVLNGKLYRCPRSGHGDDLGVIKAGKGEYFNILSSGVDKNRRKELVQVYYRKNILRHAITARSAHLNLEKSLPEYSKKDRKME